MFSNQKATESSNLSNGIIRNTIGKIFNIDNQEELEVYTKPVRKTAHFCIYLVLGLLVLNCFDIINKKTILYSIIICFLYSITDEFHQTYINGRTGEIPDILIDTIGSSIGTIIYKKAAKK